MNPQAGLPADPRFQQVLDVILRLASGDLEARGLPSEAGDDIDGLIVGINMMGEELSAAAVFKSVADRVLDTMPGLLVVINPDTTVRMVNKAALDFLGYEEMELVGMPVEMLFKGYQNGPFNGTGIDELIENGDIVDEEIEYRTRDNQRKQVLFSSSVMHDNSNRIQGIICVAHDITERKNMQEQLMLADRLASVGQLAAGVAHELNNPLTCVMGLSELVLKNNLPDNIREDIELIDSEAKRAVNVVKGLLSFTRRKEDQRDLMDINSIIKDVHKLRAYEQRVNNINFDARLATDLPQLIVNGSQLQQVFVNLIVNAEQSMIEAHKGGNLVITTEKSGDIVRISIHDDGPGITPENMSNLFTPFFTTKAAGMGTGLGLSICRGIISEHEGRIYAESEPGKGAGFIIELPVQDL